MASVNRESPSLSVADQLDHEIARLRAQVESLKKDLKIQTSTLMAATSTQALLENETRKVKGRKGAKAGQAQRKLLEQSQQQQAHKQQCLYRTCASITSFKVQDPDPNAVDGGSVLGLRFEVMSKSRFIRPYYVMLNRPYPNSRFLRVHRHTIPPCVALSGLAARHLPAPKRRIGDAEEDDEPQAQDLSRFVRGLRRELVRYHNRVSVIGDLRKAAGLESRKGKRKEQEDPIADIAAADSEAKQIRIDWMDGKTGRLVMGNDGDIVQMAVFGENGQDRTAVREMLGRSLRIEDVVERIESS